MFDLLVEGAVLPNTIYYKWLSAFVVVSCRYSSNVYSFIERIRTGLGGLAISQYLRHGNKIISYHVNENNVGHIDGTTMLSNEIVRMLQSIGVLCN